MPKNSEHIHKQAAEAAAARAKRNANQSIVNRNNYNAIEPIFRAFKSTDHTSLTKAEHDIEQVLINDTKSIQFAVTTKCPYALHAILYLMISKNPNDILNQMSDSNIHVLKTCISKVKNNSYPDIKSISNNVDELTKISLNISYEVQNVWDDLIIEMEKWSDAVVNFKRGLISMPDLAKLLNLKSVDALYSKKNKIINTHPEMATKIKDWFSGKKTGTNAKFFKIEHLEEFRELCKPGKSGPRNNKNDTKVSKAKKNKSVKKAKEPKPQAIIKVSREDLKQIKSPKADKKTQTRKHKYVTSAEEQEAIDGALQELAMEEQPKNLVELKALEAKLEALKQVLLGYKENIQKTEKEHEALMQQISKAEPAQRGTLYDQAKTLDQDIVLNQEKIISTQNEIDEGNRLLQAKRELDAKIATFLTHGK